MKKVWQVWRLVKPYLLGFLVLAGVAGAIWALIYVPKMQVPVCPPGKEGLPPKICFDIENEARKTLAYIMAGVLAIIGIYMAHRRIRALERQVLVAQEGQITERFTRAIEQLGSDRMEVRLGGIYALERIANDSDKDYWTIMETLTAYVRERVPWRKPNPLSQGQVSEDELVFSATDPKIKPATDIQAVLTILGRRKYSLDHGESQRLDLCNTDLRGINLVDAHLEWLYFDEAHMEGAILEYAHLEWVTFAGTYLPKAFLAEAHLENANLEEADLEEASLMGAHLEDASLNGARLEKASLFGSYLERTSLHGTHLEGANLSHATGLTREQLAQAITDEKTILPDYLQEKCPKDSGLEGDSKE